MDKMIKKIPIDDPTVIDFQIMWFGDGNLKAVDTNGNYSKQLLPQ